MNVVMKKGVSEPLMLELADKPVFIEVIKEADAQILIEEESALASELTIKVEEGATLKLFLLSHIKEGEHKTLKADIDIAAGARLIFHDIHLSRGVFGLNSHIRLGGDNAELFYAGLQYLQGTSKSSAELFIAHEGCRTKSEQAFRGIYDGSSRGLFLGKVMVGHEAAGSEASQRYKSVLLSDQAEALVRPQLEINNRHIKASHGASIGKLDEEALFYLCSRGLAPLEAKALLLESMAFEILRSMGDSVPAQKIAARVKNALKARAVLL